jgi:hypothetical protein
VEVISFGERDRLGRSSWRPADWFFSVNRFNVLGSFQGTDASGETPEAAVETTALPNASL